MAVLIIIIIRRWPINGEDVHVQQHTTNSTSSCKEKA